jgi:hypothetical protein
VLLAPEDPVPEPTDTDAAGLVGVFALAEPVDPTALVTVLELPSEPTVAPAVAVLLGSELPVAGAEDVVLAPAFGVAPAGVLVELPVSLVPDAPGPRAGGAGSPLDSVLAEAGTGASGVVPLTLAAWVTDGAETTFLTAGGGVDVAVAGWLGAGALVTAWACGMDCGAT